MRFGHFSPWRHGKVCRVDESLVLLGVRCRSGLNNGFGLQLGLHGVKLLLFMYSFVHEFYIRLYIFTFGLMNFFIIYQKKNMSKTGAYVDMP